MTPDPRPEVVRLLEALIREYVETGAKAPALDDRRLWSTVAEWQLAFKAATSGLNAEFVLYRAAVDQQDAELRRNVPPDDEWLRGVGVAP